MVAEGKGSNDERVTQLRKERLLLKDKIERAIHPAKT